MRVLLTGATGFVGGHAAEALAAAGHGVRALTRGRDDGGILGACGAETVRGSLEDPGSLRAAVEGAEAVVHAAGLIKARRPSEFQEVNAAGTLRLLEACAGADPPPRRFVLVSSLAAQGPSPDGRPLPPDAPCRPVSHYGASKARAERIARAFGDRLGVVVVRPPAVYGPRDRETLEFFRIASRGVRARLAGGDLLLSLVHVEDLARGLAAAVAAPAAAGGAFHLCHPEVLSLGEVMDRMAAALGKRGRAVTLPRPLLRGAGFLAEAAAGLLGRVPDFSVDKARELAARAWVADPASSREVLGWEARVGTAEGIPSTAAWYRERGWV